MTNEELIEDLKIEVEDLKAKLSKTQTDLTQKNQEWKDLKSGVDGEVARQVQEQLAKFIDPKNKEQVLGAVKNFKLIALTKKEYNELKNHVCSDSVPTDLPANWKSELARIPQLEQDLAISQANEKPADLPTNWKEYLTRPNIPISELDWKNDYSQRPNRTMHVANEMEITNLKAKLARIRDLKPNWN